MTMSRWRQKPAHMACTSGATTCRWRRRANNSAPTALSECRATTNSNARLWRSTKARTTLPSAASSHRAPNPRPCAHTETAREARPRLNIPIIAIGGITPENGAALIEAGADMLAVIDGVFPTRPIFAPLWNAMHDCFPKRSGFGPRSRPAPSSAAGSGDIAGPCSSPRRVVQRPASWGNAWAQTSSARESSAAFGVSFSLVTFSWTSKRKSPTPGISHPQVAVNRARRALYIDKEITIRYPHESNRWAGRTRGPRRADAGTAYAASRARTPARRRRESHRCQAAQERHVLSKQTTNRGELRAAPACGRQRQCRDALSRWRRRCISFTAALATNPGTMPSTTSSTRTISRAKPKHLSFAEAAAVPLALITAWEALDDRARLKAGETGADSRRRGRLRPSAVQLAKHRGARVAATVSGADKVAFVKSARRRAHNRLQDGRLRAGGA